MRSLPKRIVLVSIASILTLFVTFYLIDSKPRGDIKAATFSRLERIRKAKKQETIEYFDNVRRLASGVKDDKVMLDFFDTLRQDDYLPDSSLEYEIDKHYVNKYGDFYDILFVDSTGYVFHSIRKESDYRKSLSEGDLSHTRLARALEQKSGDQFVEYEFYSPSDEPAAFFVVLLQDGSEHIGWVVLQCSINRVNTMLTDRKGLGRTGEVYLVNTDKLMLSDSRFMEDSTVLRLKVDTWAVKEALRNNVGERIIEDYRETRVFSSFEKFDLFGTSWIIIAEVDEDEVITEHYRKYKKYFEKEFRRYLADLPRTKHVLEDTSHTRKRIDIGEFAKATPGTVLQTNGVSTCSAITILFPNRFGYLTHLSPTDEIYISNPLTKLFLKERKSDFLGELIRRVTYYDVYPYELKKLQFVIIAPHHNGFGNAVDRILDKGMELGNIKFLYNPDARGANVLLDVADNSIEVEWYSEQFAFLEYASDVEDLGTILKNIIEYADGLTTAS